MRNVVLSLKDPQTDKIKIIKTGFSWKTLLFGFMVPLFRKDWNSFLIFTPIYFITFGMASIPFAFVYNKKYIETLFEKGYNLLYFTGDLTEEELQSLIKIPLIERKLNNNPIVAIA
ncbi:MAG: hypothetical protein PHE89_00785 [Alphaproteobacteria bacterium]|nr:hypothetical protein [Alphaproteobacteria bacterium]